MSRPPTKNPGAASILVVDDTPANLQMLVGLLNDRGYRPRPVTSGRLAFQAAKNDPPDLILLDIGMPDMNGYEVCERLKADPQLRDIPVIFISAHAETDDKVEAFRLGGVDYVTKPFQIEEVKARVAVQLELRRQARELEVKNAELRRLEKLRDDLVHMIVHDLRSPLSAMSGYLGLALRAGRGTVSPDILRDIEDALKATSKMNGMVNAVLDVSELEGGRMKLKLGSCDLCVVVGEVVAGLSVLAQDRRLVMEPRRANTSAVVDKEIVARVVQNLVSNALKFTPAHGEIRIGVDPDKGGVRISVADDGPGIADEHRDTIFEKFGRVETHGADRIRGMGLGLAFCKLAVEAHGGRIGVDGKPGKGSVFWLFLPKEGPGPHEQALEGQHGSRAKQ
jgi:two-component system, sensor histidine kinase and response regulator